MLTNSTLSSGSLTHQIESATPNPLTGHEVKTRTNLNKLMPVSAEKVTDFSSLPQSMRALSIETDIKKSIESITPYQAPRKMTFEIAKNKIQMEMVQHRIEQLQQHHRLAFTFTEKIKLFSELHQKYVSQYSIINTDSEEVLNFIIDQFLEDNASNLENDSNKKELEHFLNEQIKGSTQKTYDELKTFLIQENITPETKKFSESNEINIINYSEEVSDKIIRKLKPIALKEFIEEIFEVDLKKFTQNFLLHKETPYLFKKIVSEEIHSEYKNNSLISNFLMECPSSTKSFIEHTLHFHTNTEKALGYFMKSFLSEARTLVNEYKSTGLFEKNRDEFNKEIESILAQYPYIEEKSPRLFNLLKNNPEKAIANGLSISKKDFSLKNTLIISAHTFDAYALTNTLSMKDMMKLKDKHPDLGLPELTRLDQKLKHIIGEGSFGKVRFARNIKTGGYVAVKKITQLDAAKIEVDSYLTVGKGKNLVSLYNHATAINKNGQEKSYLFIEFVQGSDGKNHFDKIKDDPSINAQTNTEHAKELQRIAQEYIFSAVELHKKGVFHCDIKPENFLHASNGDIKIIDYGLYHTEMDRYKPKGGTPRFACPEAFYLVGKKCVYDAQKHDSFSLGICLMEQTRAFEKRDARSKLTDSLGNNYSVYIRKIQLKNRMGFHFVGFKNTAKLSGNNIDEVIMKLMDKDPPQRITPEQALQLPYFS